MLLFSAHYFLNLVKTVMKSLVSWTFGDRWFSFISLNQSSWKLVENAHYGGIWGWRRSGIHRCPVPRTSNSGGGNPCRWTGRRVGRSSVGSPCRQSRHTTMCLDQAQVPSHTVCTGLALGRSSSYKSGGTLHMIKQNTRRHVAFTKEGVIATRLHR